MKPSRLSIEQSRRGFQRSATGGAGHPGRAAWKARIQNRGFAIRRRRPRTGGGRRLRGSDANARGRRVPGKQEDGVSRALDFGARLELFWLRNGVFAGFRGSELAVLSDGAEWIWNVAEEIFGERDPTFILDQFHAIDCAAAAVRTLTLDKDKR